MPISAAAQKRYPPEWPQIRLQILERANWNAVMRFPVFSHDDQTITALVDRWANVYAETAIDATKGTT